MRIYGLTGGIGSGKSTVATLFEGLGVPVLYADELAREAVARGSDGLRDVIAAFSADVLTPEGALDRRKLAQVIFNDPEAKARLEGIIHPRVRELFMRRTAALAEDGVDAILYEVPILFEQNLAPMFTATVVVCAPEEARLRRVIARDGVSAEEVRDRMRHQLSDAEKRAKATHVVENDAGLDALGARVAVLARELFGIESTAVPGDAESDSRP